MASRPANDHQSLLGQTLKAYRKEHAVTQEQLAAELNVEPRTLRAGKNGRPTHTINELYPRQRAAAY